MMRFGSVADYEIYLARLAAFPEYVEQHVALMRSGLESGMTMPRVVLEGYEVTIESHVVEDPKRSVFYPAPLGVLERLIRDFIRERRAAPVTPDQGKIPGR